MVDASPLPLYRPGTTAKANSRYKQLMPTVSPIHANGFGSLGRDPKGPSHVKPCGKSPRSVLLGLVVALLGASCMKRDVPSQSPPRSEPGQTPPALAAETEAGSGGIAPGDFVVARMRISRIGAARGTYAHEKVIRISLADTTVSIEPETDLECPASVEAFTVDCGFQRFSIRSFSRIRKNDLRFCAGTRIYPYGIRRSVDDPLQYYITRRGRGINAVRAANQVELFRKVESRLVPLLGAEFRELAERTPTDEAKLVEKWKGFVFVEREGTEEEEEQEEN